MLWWPWLWAGSSIVSRSERARRWRWPSFSWVWRWSGAIRAGPRHRTQELRLGQTGLEVGETLFHFGDQVRARRNLILQLDVRREGVLVLLEQLQNWLNRRVASAPNGNVRTMVLLAVFDVQVGDLVVVLLDERDRVVVGRREVADIEVDAVVLPVAHQRVVALQCGGLVGVVGRVVAVITDQKLVLVGDRRDALGHGERRARRDALDAEALGHREAVFDVLVLHAVAHVIAEQGDVDAGVVEFLAHGLPCGVVRVRAPLHQLGLSRIPCGLLFGGQRSPSAAATRAAALSPARRCAWSTRSATRSARRLPGSASHATRHCTRTARHCARCASHCPWRAARSTACSTCRTGSPGGSTAATQTTPRAGCAGEGFAVVRHEFRFAEPDLDIRLDDRFRVRVRDAIEAVGYGADLHAEELRVDLRAKRHGQRHGGERELSNISPGIKHACFLSVRIYRLSYTEAGAPPSRARGSPAGGRCFYVKLHPLRKVGLTYLFASALLENCIFEASHSSLPSK